MICLPSLSEALMGIWCTCVYIDMDECTCVYVNVYVYILCLKTEREIEVWKGRCFFRKSTWCPELLGSFTWVSLSRLPRRGLESSRWASQVHPQRQKGHVLAGALRWMEINNIYPEGMIQRKRSTIVLLIDRTDTNATREQPIRARVDPTWGQGGSNPATPCAGPLVVDSWKKFSLHPPTIVKVCFSSLNYKIIQNQA